MPKVGGLQETSGDQPIRSPLTSPLSLGVRRSDRHQVAKIIREFHSYGARDIRQALSPMTQEATQLILICCHGTWLGGPTLGEDENEWLIAPFQHGETPTFIEHIKAGLRLLSSTPQSLLMFSGYFSCSCQYRIM